MKVSLVTVCINSEKYIRDTIISVLNQDYSDIEYILIDGASSDATLEIIREYEALFEGRMHWISEADKGLYDAMNKGIRLATGDVVGILNSDDFFSNTTIISQIVSTFEHNQCDAVYGDIHFVNPQNLAKPTRYYSSALFRRQLMRFGLIPAHPTFYTYKKYFTQFGYYQMDYTIAADFELLLRFIYIHKLKIKYIPVDFVTMRTGGSSTKSRQSHKTIMRDHLRAFREHKLFTNRFILSLRYIYKLLELIYFKIKMSHK